MPISKVRLFIRRLGAPKLTEEEIAIIKDHHEYHGDKKITIMGALPDKAVFVRVVDHMGYHDSVIDSFCYKNDCTEDAYIREADEDEEIKFIKKWIKEFHGEEKYTELMKRVEKYEKRH